MIWNEDAGDARARAGRVAALVLWMAGGDEGVRAEDRARIEEVCEQVVRARKGRFEDDVVDLVADEGAADPERRTRTEEDVERFLDASGQGDHEALALAEILEAIRVRPELADVSRKIEAARWVDDGLANIVLSDEPSAEEPGHGLGDDVVVLNVGGLDDPRQIRAIAEVAKDAASAPEAKRVVFIAAEALDPTMRHELMAALGDEGDRGDV